MRSACVPAWTCRQDGHEPQPPDGHSSAAAKARAATDRPDPGGPVNSHAWVIAPGPGRSPASTAAAAAAALRSWAPTASCPVRSSNGVSPAEAGWLIGFFSDGREVAGGGLGYRGHRVGEHPADPVLDV